MHALATHLLAAQSLEREAEAIGRWVPPGIMAALLLAALYALGRILLSRLSKQDAHLAKAATDLADLRTETSRELSAIRERMPTMATTEQLGRMGDRFDARISELNKDLGNLRGRMEQIERRRR